MTNQHQFIPFHINASSEDFNAINGIKRYIILCGSDERAKKIASEFNDLTIKKSSRNHHLYLGSVTHHTTNIPIGAISTGMGAASADIVINELFLLGATRFLRIGTAGSLQPMVVKKGSLVIATAAVRDENTSNCYIYPEFPAVASYEFINALINASDKLGYSSEVFKGIIHTKSSFYAREMSQSFLKENQEYMENLNKAGVLATEMECSQLFILSSLLKANFNNQDTTQQLCLSGAILAIVGDETPISHDKKSLSAIDKAIKIGLLAIKYLAIEEIKYVN